MLSRLLVCALSALVAFAVVAGAFLFLSGGSWNMVEAGRELANESRREQGMKQRLALIQADMASKSDVAQAVIDERMTLSEAAQAFRQLQMEFREAAQGEFGPLPNLKTDEEFRQAVQSWVRAELKKNSLRTQASGSPAKPLLQ